MILCRTSEGYAAAQQEWEGVQPFRAAHQPLTFSHASEIELPASHFDTDP